MSVHKTKDAMWDDSPVDVSEETSMIWSIANKLRGPYQSDKYKDVIIPMTIIRRFECALEPTKEKVVEQYEKNPNYPAKAMYRISGFQFYNTSRFTLAELCNDPDHLADNFVSYIQGFSSNVQDILLSEAKGLDFKKQITKMDKNNRLLAVVKAFSELDLNPRTIDNVKMGYIFEDLSAAFLKMLKQAITTRAETLSNLWSISCSQKGAMIFSMMERSLQFWIRPVAREVCFPRDTTSSSVTIRLPMCVSSVRKSIRNPTRCALLKCLSKARTKRTSSIRIL